MAGDAVKCLGWIILCKKLKSQSLFPTHHAKAHLHRYQLLPGKIRRKGCLYVAKTAFFHKLLTGADARFFLARPRRFGKSLMISIFKVIFEGRRELFEDLAIARTDWKWEKCPVMHFNLGFPAAATSAAEFAARFPGG